MTAETIGTVVRLSPSAAHVRRNTGGEMTQSGARARATIAACRHVYTTSRQIHSAAAKRFASGGSRATPRAGRRGLQACQRGDIFLPKVRARVCVSPLDGHLSSTMSAPLCSPWHERNDEDWKRERRRGKNTWYRGDLAGRTPDNMVFVFLVIIIVISTSRSLFSPVIRTTSRARSPRERPRQAQNRTSRWTSLGAHRVASHFLFFSAKRAMSRCRSPFALSPYYSLPKD